MITNFVNTHGFTFPILRDNQAWATTAHYGIRSWSEFRLLGEQGNLVRFHFVDPDGNTVTPQYLYFDPDLIDRMLAVLEARGS